MIEIRPMDESYLHLTCLHAGPVDTRSYRAPPDPLPGGHPPLPWDDDTLRRVLATYRQQGIGHPRPAAFQWEMIRRYGTCALLAWDGPLVVGHVRFFPAAVARLLVEGEPDPSPVLTLPPEEDAHSLWVQCVMTCRPYVARVDCPALPADGVGDQGPAALTDADGRRRFRTVEEAGARRGVGQALVRELIAWAQAHGWRRIVKLAHCDLDWFYGIMGGGGKAFWEKAGFRVAEAVQWRPFVLSAEFAPIVEAQRRAAGMTEEEVWTWYWMVWEELDEAASTVL